MIDNKTWYLDRKYPMGHLRPVVKPISSVRPKSIYMRAYRARRGAEYAMRQAEYSRAYRKEKAAEISAQQTEWRAANKESIAARKAESYRKHKGTKAKYDLLYRTLNVDKRAAYALAWRQANPDMKAQIDRNRKARVRGAEGSHTVIEIKAMLQAQGGLCRACSVDITGGYHLDHIVAVSKGGSNWISNIQLLCRTCNLSKHDLDNEEFLTKRCRSRSSVG